MIVSVDETAVTNLIGEFEIIDAIGVYDLSSLAYIYKSAKLKNKKFITSMVARKCFENFDSLYFIQKNESYYIYRYNDLLTVVLLMQKRSINKILLELKIRRFSAELSKK